MKAERHSNQVRAAVSCARFEDHAPEVLIVDDDPRVADVLEQLLEDEGFIVSREGDGYSALTHIQRKRPDVVLADMRMPRLDGVGLLREINSRWRDQIDVILMSATESPRGLNVPFLQKPFDLDDVISTICNYPNPA